MPALCNTQKAEHVPGHRVVWFILCFDFFVRILSGELQSVFLTVNAQRLPLCSVHFLVPALAWQAGGVGRCPAFRAVRSLVSLKEKPLCSGTGHILQEGLTAYREERGGKPFNHPSKKQQGLPGMGYHIFTDCTYFSLVM